MFPLPAAVTHDPIYWEPSGYFNPNQYRNILNQYLSDVAAACGTDTNVYSTATEYDGSNGSISYDSPESHRRQQPAAERLRPHVRDVPAEARRVLRVRER
jgi:hypothetical protein